jgi:hypothetical protein
MYKLASLIYPIFLLQRKGTYSLLGVSGAKALVILTEDVSMWGKGIGDTYGRCLYVGQNHIDDTNENWQILLSWIEDFFGIPCTLLFLLLYLISTRQGV